MKIKTLSTIVPVVAFAAVSLAVPASADQHERHASSSHAQSAPAPRGGNAAPRVAAPRSAPAPQQRAQSPFRSEGPRVSQGPRVNEGPRVTTPRFDSRGPAPRTDSRTAGPRVESRSYPQSRGFAPQVDSRGFTRAEPRVIERGNVRDFARRGDWDGNRGRFDVAVRRGGFLPIVPRAHFVSFAPLYRPYYYFRPHFRLGFSLFVGYPVVYPSYWYDPDWYYADPVPVDGYAYGSGAPADSGAYGGVSFDITPSNAQVYVDGEYEGIASDFSSTKPPLTMTIGSHHIEIRAPGYQTLTFDTDVNSREVVPYQGTMQAIR